MKKIVSVLSSVAAASMLTFMIAGTPINQSELPEAAKTFLGKYFSKVQVVKAEKDNGRRGMEYEVDLADGTEVEFKTNGAWKDVKMPKGNAVPAGIVPAAIAKYISDNFDGLTIEEISRKRGGYEVELSNGSELKLTEDAKPLIANQKNSGKRKRK